MNQIKKSHVRKSRYVSPKTDLYRMQKNSQINENKSKNKGTTARSGKTAKSARPVYPQYNVPDKLVHKRRKKNKGIFWGTGAACCAVIFLVVLFGKIDVFSSIKNRLPEIFPDNIVQNQKIEEVFVEMEPSKEIVFSPHSTAATAPEKMINRTEIEVDGTVLDSAATYVSDSEISFDVGDTYTDVDGIITFRGNNFRDSATCGTAEMAQLSLEKKWSVSTGSLSSGGTVWTGSGWTGQPLVCKWPEEIKQHMNLYDWAKEKKDLVEVIYACMDGYVYFIDLDSGQLTRDSLYLGYTFKGSGALDPRGYPILYVGAGYNSNSGTARVFVVNLLDCSTMYTFGDNDPFSLRGNLSFFDASPLVDAETDTLIYPGENGILYLIKLNTSYNAQNGTISISPGKTVKWRYNGIRSGFDSFWLGMEDSPAIYKGFVFLADNGGHLMCLDLNSLKLIWVQDILDDSNSTPVLSIENGHLYLYVSTSFRLGWRSYNQATVPIWKIDAETGEIVWQTDYECYTNDGVSGGVQSTIALGNHELSDYIYVTVSKTENNVAGVLACLEKSTGKVVWEHSAGYAWSSPVCVYREDGTGKVLYCSSDGNMYLLDGKSGEVHNSLSLSEGVIEASPAVYKDYAVVGTRDCTIQCINLQ